ncbi:MAG: HPr family phosphocarrier protein [Eubacteriales bacterium]
MESFTFVVRDPLGIHARPAGVLVKKASEFSSDCSIEKNGKKADLKRLFGVLGLCVKSGDEIQIKVSGQDEKEARNALEMLITQLLS